MTAPDLKRLRDLATKATPGPWSVLSGSLKVGCEHPTKGWHCLFDTRGWGFFTGQGHAALGWSEDRAFDQQTSNADFIAACSPDVILELIDMAEGKK